MNNTDFKSVMISSGLKQEDIRVLNDWAGFLSFKECYLLKALLQCEENIILLDTGNQAGKNAVIAMHYIIRLMGLHPIEKKNMRPDTEIRTLRFAAQNLPLDSEGSGEVKNTVYPAFKKFLPPFLIKKDISARKPVITLNDIQGGSDIYIEHVSYGQVTQSQAGVQRWSVYLDEQSPYAFYQEQIPRLLASGGDIVIGITPVEGVSWIYEDIYEKARVVYNSQAVIDYMRNEHKKKVLPIERYDKKNSIAVIRAATDDNPTFLKEDVDEKMMQFDNESDYEVRRYGIFHQITGVVYKDFEPRINSREQFGHVISRNQYFPEGMPYEYLQARGIDFHAHVNWACGWMALSKQNEAFVWQEYNPSPDRMVTLEICQTIGSLSKDHTYGLNLIDPTAAITQVNTGLAPIQDMNRIFSQLRKEGLCTGGYWQTWDSKSERGRDIVKERLKNSRLVGRPFANRIVKNGVEINLPTIWFLDTCPITINAFKNWRWEQWADRNSLQTKEEKNKPDDRYSHFPVMIECIFKHNGFSVGRYSTAFVPPRKTGYENALRGRA